MGIRVLQVNRLKTMMFLDVPRFQNLEYKNTLSGKLRQVFILFLKMKCNAEISLDENYSLAKDVNLN